MSTAETHMTGASNTSPALPEAPPAKSRIDWVDFAKGICIFAVVMLHTNHYVEENRFFASGWMDYVVEFAKPFRMPDFFLLSGLFVPNVINRPWKQYLDTKVVHFYYFYLIWLPIIFIAFDVRHAALNNWHDAANLPIKFVKELFDPSYPLWFIHSLPIYFVLTRLLKNVPWWIVWGATAFLQSSGFSPGITVVDQFCLRFVYFYSGYVFSSQVFRITDYVQQRPRKALIYLVLWAALEETLVHYKWATIPGISLILGYLGALAVICVACLLCKKPWMYWLRYLGKNSIVVYLTFMIPMAVIDRLLRWQVTDVGTASLTVTIASVAISVLIFRTSKNTVFEFLYKRPAWAYLRLDTPKRAAEPAVAQS